jgi:hypothetical protein
MCLPKNQFNIESTSRHDLSPARAVKYNKRKSKLFAGIEDFNSQPLNEELLLVILIGIFLN